MDSLNLSISSINLSNGISTWSVSSEVAESGICSITEDFSAVGAACADGVPGVAASAACVSSASKPAIGSSCSSKDSMAPLIWLEYFSKTKVSAFLVAASFKASASIIALSNMSDIFTLLEDFLSKINSISYG